jgi:hypothetical protein
MRGGRAALKTVAEVPPVLSYFPPPFLFPASSEHSLRSSMLQECLGKMHIYTQKIPSYFCRQKPWPSVKGRFIQEFLNSYLDIFMLT